MLRPEEEVIEADEEEAEAMADFLGFMVGHGGRALAIVWIRFTIGLVRFVRNM